MPTWARQRPRPKSYREGPSPAQQPAVPRQGGARRGEQPSLRSRASASPGPMLGCPGVCGRWAGKAIPGGGNWHSRSSASTSAHEMGDLWGQRCGSHGCAAKATDVHGATGRAEHGVKRPKQQRTTTTGRRNEREGEKLRTRRQKAPSARRRSGKSRNKGKTAPERRQWGSCTVHGVHRAALGALLLITRMSETSL